MQYFESQVLISAQLSDYIKARAKVFKPGRQNFSPTTPNQFSRLVYVYG
jgi:hypothetical protein